MTRIERLKAVWWQVLVLAVVIVGLSGAGYRLWYQQGLRVHYADGFCPRGTWPQQREGVAIPGHTAILIDTSDQIAADVADVAFDRIDAWARDTLSAPFLQKVSIYGLPESASEIPTQSGRSWCVPRHGALANVLYENPRVVEIEFRRFLRGVKVELDSLRTREQADQSPIVETMSYLAQHHPDLDSFVLVSDMLQHSDLAGHYAQDPAMTDRARQECGKVFSGDRMRTVWVYYVDRPVDVQERIWPTSWWRECLGAVAGRTMN